MINLLLRYGFPCFWLIGAGIALYYTIRATIVARAIALSVRATLGGSDVGTAREALRVLQSDMVLRGLDVRLLLILCILGIAGIGLLNLPFPVARTMTTCNIVVCFALIAYKSHYELKRYGQSVALADRILSAEKNNAEARAEWRK